MTRWELSILNVCCICSFIFYFIALYAITHKSCVHLFTMTFQADTNMCSMNGSVGNRSVSFKVLGEPVPQLRLKLARGKYVDPSGRDKGKFSACVDAIMRHMNIRIRPFFPINIQVGVRIVFVCSRPKFHFQGGDKSKPLKPIHSSRNIAYNNRQADIDNLVKFVLDAISHSENRTILTNNRQVIHVLAVKMFEEWNKGRYTFIEVYQWNENKTIHNAPVMAWLYSKI